MSGAEARAAALADGVAVVDRAWDEVRRSSFAQQSLGEIPSRLPDLSFAEAERKAAVGKDLLARASAIDETLLPHDVALSVRLVKFRAATWAREADWYWTVIDPSGVGFFGLFLPTAYCGGFLLNQVRQFAAQARFEQHGDLDRYLGLAADYARLIDQMRIRTVGQADRGIYMPRAQVGQARGLIAAFKGQARPTWAVDATRLTAVRSDGFGAELERRIGRIEEAFDALAAVCSDDYLGKAPDQVGMGQYPGGRAIYQELVKLHLTLDLTPEQVHAIGLERMASIEAAMAAVATEAGFAGDAAGFRAALDRDPAWRADSVPGVAAVFQRYIDRMHGVFSGYFSAGAKAKHAVAPLPEALQGSMTFGYYDVAKPNRPEGRYLFNGANLAKAPLYNIGALTYHELVPGHHLHFSTQSENARLHPVRRLSFVNAFNEGWAEYAATLAGEMGLYPEPAERYGRLMMDAFLTTRLVVDTGMNALGWSLERARDYMRAHSGMSETEIASETIRYSADIPGQALAYKMGDTMMMSLREAMRSGMGSRFDIKHFHSVVLGAGALPLPDLEWHVNWAIAEARG